MKREELESHLTHINCSFFKCYLADKADSVMDDLEAQVNNLEKANAELIKRVIELENENNKLEEQNQSLFNEAYESNGKVLKLESQLKISEEFNNKRALRIKELEYKLEGK